MILGFPIHWYGLLYLLAFIIAYVSLPRLLRYRSLTLSPDTLSAILSAVVLGVIVGGRLGYVVFYELPYFVQHPLEIFAVWNGGMSSHGGFLGVTISLWFALKKRKVPLLPFLDCMSVPVALGLAFGRFGNFINLELYGTVTTLPWAISIPGVEGLRHPTFFYSMAQDLCMACVCYAMLRSRRFETGQTFAMFLLLYGVLRFVVEIFRDQPYGYMHLLGIELSRGQLLTLPIIAIAIVLLVFLQRRSGNGETISDQ